MRDEHPRNGGAGGLHEKCMIPDPKIVEDDFCLCIQVLEGDLFLLPSTGVPTTRRP
jgi:hypothetical protein